MHRVFVYGTLKRGCGNHHLLDRSEFKGAAVTVYCYVMRSVGFPHVSQANACPAVEWGRVVGELYTVDDATLARLDRLEGEGRMYHRRNVPVRNGDGRMVHAFMYVAGEYLARQGELVEPSPDGRVEWCA